jgi:hypothetical protein
MTKVMSADLEVDCDFLFFKVAIKKDNGDYMSDGFRVLNFQRYNDKDMDLKIFIESMRILLSRLEKEVEEPIQKQ